jgi:hypothetical protein
VKEKCRERLT